MKWKSNELILTSAVFIILNLDMIFSHNVSECVKMYFNNTIKTPCVNNKTCCYIEYTNFGANSTFNKCILKKNETDDICPELSPTMSYFYSSLNICDCIGSYIKSTLLILISLMFLF